MDFSLSEEHKLLRQTISRFVKKNIIPLAEEIDAGEEIPSHLLQDIAKQGYFGIRYPEAYGGAGSDMISYIIMVEEMAYGSMSVAAAVSVHTSAGTMPIYRFGSEEQKQKYLVPAIKGEKIGCFALTEPNAGSDVAAIQTTARKVRDGYLLNGSKTFITNALRANYAIVAAKTDFAKGRKGISLFIVDKETPGFQVLRKLSKMSIRGSDTGELIFEECFVPSGALLGEEGKGFDYLKESLVDGRIMTAANCLGVCRAAFDAGLTYARQREQFGQQIGKFQAVNFKLADMAVDLEAARLLVYYSAWLSDVNKERAKEASIAKLFASEAANRIATKAVEIHGGYGIMMEYPVQRLYRDARFLTIGEGTSDIQRLVIGNLLVF
ncbi:acyl-CoA dehydrogenase family protein [Desulfoscipio gibsoniae]|uniref:Acyl-CoA dehydrogenase n=1 Tax=Desulfoscipio gibsoniae DSM 7213 TaxID=767817 RepID=R4KBV9_9FIRM|nr:acyl-CoA dehydrogenase family protein [Desulfoscipio gibsoniae]AGL00034.1 acyl-CoA dehydrogenase [Desulfoscipio gibsoniae DSM 7213]